MHRTVLAVALALFAAGTGTALASSYCDVPASEWQPAEALQQKLETEGWQVKGIKTEDGCYEVYAVDGNGKRVEALFDPKTFELVKNDAD